MSEELLNGTTAFDPSVLDDIDPTSVGHAGAAFPSIQWHTGNPDLKPLGKRMGYVGGWFVEEGKIDEKLLTAAGWTKESRTYRNGKEAEGFWRREIAVSVIAMRQCWEVGEGTERRTIPWDAKNGGGYREATKYGKVTGRTHLLVVIKGLESAGPVVLTLSGNSGKSLTGKGAFVPFADTVIRKANQVSGKNSPYRVWWLPVGANRDEKGEPVFTVTGEGANTSRIVVPVAIGLPPKAEQVQLDRFFVGAQVLAQVNAILADSTTKAWITEWDKAGTAAADDTHAANGNGTTEPQPETAGAAALAEMGL